jgi:hypothetical protein
MPISPPSPRWRESAIRATSLTCPSRTDTIRPVSRSVTSADPSGRNATPHGVVSPLTTSVADASTDGAPDTDGRANQPRHRPTPTTSAPTTSTAAPISRARLTWAA